MRKCHHIKDPEVGRVLIPGCIGTAVYGLSGCTCYPDKIRHLEDEDELTLEDRLAAIEERLAKLEAPPSPHTEKGE